MKEKQTDPNYFRPDHYKKYPIVLSSADGCMIEDDKGNEYLDLSAIMGAVNCGHNVPKINELLIEQINKMWTSNFFATEMQLEAISKVDAILPKNTSLAALYSTGAEAIEFALRLARAATGRKHILAFKDHFHGKTHGAMQLCAQFPDAYGPVPDSYRTVFESDGSDDPEILEKYLSSVPVDDLAAVIFEPVIGYSGPRLLHKDFLKIIRNFCDQNGVAMIADEILTGFHRCRGWFCSCQGEVTPDILVFGKGLGNGFPISAVACVDSFAVHMSDALPGSTFAGNSLGCAVASAVIDFMQEHRLAEKAAILERVFCEYFSSPRFESYGLRLDGMGGLLSISFEDPSFGNVQDIYLQILKGGVIISHTQKYLRITPPLTIDIGEFERGLEIIGKCIEASASSSPV